MPNYEGVFHGGVFVPNHPLLWKNGTRVLVTVLEDDCKGIPVSAAAESPDTPLGRGSQRGHDPSGTANA